jgi:ribose transport system substrate-binding protein
MNKTLSRTVLFGVVVVLIVGLLVVGCKQQSVAKTKAAEAKVSGAQEEYVWICSLSTFPLFLAHDYPALKQLAKELGVKMTFSGPKEFDVEAQNTVLEQQIAIKPAGVLFLSFGDVHNASINKVISAGIPLVCVDGDSPNSKRLAFIGTGWKALGAKQAEIMGSLLRGKGKVILSAMIPNDNTNLARAGYEEYMKKNFPDIKIVTLLNDKGDVSTAADLVSKAIQTYRDINGFSGFDGASGPGIAMAIREARMQGQIHVTCVDDTPDILQAIKDGIIDATLVQKREAFESLALLTLYNYNHPQTEILRKYKEAGFAMMPETLYTGTLVLTKENVDQLQALYDYEKSIQ